MNLRKIAHINYVFAGVFKSCRRAMSGPKQFKYRYEKFCLSEINLSFWLVKHGAIKLTSFSFSSWFLILGLMAMTKTQKHACLALGTLIKTFRNSSLHSEKTEKLLNSLQHWLASHNQSRLRRFRVIVILWKKNVKIFIVA